MSLSVFTQAYCRREIINLLATNPVVADTREHRLESGSPGFKGADRNRIENESRVSVRTAGQRCPARAVAILDPDTGGGRPGRTWPTLGARPAHDARQCGRTACGRLLRRVTLAGMRLTSTVDGLVETTTVPETGRRLRCSRCGAPSHAWACPCALKPQRILRSRAAFGQVVEPPTHASA